MKKSNYKTLLIVFLGLLLIVLGCIILINKNNSNNSNGNNTNNDNIQDEDIVFSSEPLSVANIKGNISNEKIYFYKYEYDTDKYLLEGMSSKREDNQYYSLLATYDCYSENCKFLQGSASEEFAIIEDDITIVYDIKNNIMYETDIYNQGNNERKNRADFVYLESTSDFIKGLIIVNESSENKYQTSYYKYNNRKFTKFISVKGYVDNYNYTNRDLLNIINNENGENNSYLVDLNQGKKINDSNTKYNYGMVNTMDTMKAEIINYLLLINNDTIDDVLYVKYDILDDKYKPVFNQFYSNYSYYDNKYYVFNSGETEYKVYDNNTKQISSKTTEYPILAIVYNYILVNKNGKIVLTDFNNTEIVEIESYNKDTFDQMKVYYCSQIFIDIIGMSYDVNYERNEGVYIEYDVFENEKNVGYEYYYDTVNNKLNKSNYIHN